VQSPPPPPFPPTGCAGDDRDEPPSGARTVAGEVDVTVSDAAAAARKVEIVGPGDGETVANPVRVRVSVSGFELVEPDGDTRGATGHLHAFVDRDQLPPAEQIIPSDPETVDFWTEGVELGRLPPGRHTIMVVASDGYRVPFQPPVWDRVTVTVR
jgi:hypothetical protein